MAIKQIYSKALMIPCICGKVNEIPYKRLLIKYKTQMNKLAKNKEMDFVESWLNCSMCQRRLFGVMLSLQEQKHW